MGRRKGSKNQTTPDRQKNEPRDTKKQTWFLTINNPTGGELTPIETLLASEIKGKLRYIKWAAEEGEANGVPHIHIALFLKEQERFSAVKKVFPRCRIEDELFGSNQQLIDYIGNPDFVHSEKHRDPEKRSKRKGGVCTAKGEYGSVAGIRMSSRAEGSTMDSRLNAIQEAIKAGKTIPDLYEIDFPMMVRYSNQISQYITVLAQQAKNSAIVERIEEKRREIERDNLVFAEYMAHLQEEQQAINREIENDLGCDNAIMIPIEF